MGRGDDMTAVGEAYRRVLEIDLELTWLSSTMRDHVICESRLLLTPRHPAEADTIDTVRSLYERST